MANVWKAGICERCGNPIYGWLDPTGHEVHGHFCQPQIREVVRL